MMKLKNFMAVTCMATAILGISGCSEDDIQGQNAQKAGTIVASVDKTETRTSVGTQNNILWSTNDAFGVYYTKEPNSGNKFFEYKLESGAGTGSGAFSLNGSPSSEGFTMGSYAVYPYQAAMTLSGTTLSMNMNGTSPLAYTQDSNGPMYAPVSADVPSSISFKHLAALLKVTLNKMPATATKFKVTASNVIAGNFTADLSATNPELIAAAGNTNDANKSVTVTFTAVMDEGSQTFYLPLPTGTYASLNISLLDNTDKTLYSMTWSSTVVARAEILTANLDVVTIDATTPSKINSALEEVIKAPASGDTQTTNIALTGEINTSNADEANRTIEVPVIQNSNANLAFTNLTTSTEAPLILKSSETPSETPTTAINKISVAVPETASEADAPSVTITMPKTTVTLAPAGATATYNKVVAKTATNTIVVAAGVTVKELVIAGGNVEVYGTVEKLIRDVTNSATVEVSSLGAANIKDVTMPANFKFESTWDGISKVAPTANKIYTAAQLAYYQSKTAPNAYNSSSLPVTINNDTELFADIDLANKPWLGMIISDKTFDGKSHTIKNLNMSEYILNQQETIFTPEACIGLFAAVYGASTVKEITLDGVTIKPDAPKSPKWVGSLVGFSKGTGTIYTNCVAKNVEILTKGKSSIRVGGLIGYIEKSRGTTDATATLTGCKVETASIAASYSYGGLVGSLFDSVDFINCSTSGITLSLNGDCTDALGYVSKFIGDVANNPTHNRVIQFTNCSADLLTKEEQTALNFSGISSQQNKAGEYTPVSPFVGIVDSPAQMTLKVSDRTLVNGTDYNHFILTETGNNSAEGYDKTEGSWAN